MKYLIFFVMFTLAGGCGKSESQDTGKGADAKPEPNPVSVKKAPAPLKKIAQRKKLNKKVVKVIGKKGVTIDDIAKIIAGVVPKEHDEIAPIIKDPVWRRHKRRIDKVWKTYISKREKKIRAWSAQELKAAHSAGGFLFYPFSGPDVLHAEMFFPRSESILMIGLEPCGKTVNLKGLLKKDFVRYLERVKATINDITRFSFFRTNAMKRQMFNKDVKRINGALPTLLFFLARLGHEVIKVEPVTITPQGVLVADASTSAVSAPQADEKPAAPAPVKKTDTALKASRSVKKGPMAMAAMAPAAPAPSPQGMTAMGMGPGSMKAAMGRRRKGMSAVLSKEKKVVPKIYTVHGNRILFKRPDGSQVTLVYLSINLGNAPFMEREGLEKMTAVVTYLKSLPVKSTYIKSASYLMHKSYFSIIRDIVLEKSQFLLQDDSGIPVRYFPEASWSNTFYGSYTQPIKLFKIRKQDDLRKIYKKKNNVKPLPFGIGYQIARARSNLQFSVKKSTPPPK